MVCNHAFDSSRPQPMTDGLHRIVESGDASAVSHVETGPFREPCHLCAVYDWTRQGTDGFLGHDRCQGQTFGSQARRHEALILMGGWCGAHMADTARKKTGMRLRLPVGASVPSGTPRNKVVKSGVGGSIAS
jgi:hypothetical protein